jgi:hypothetical protein
MIGMITMILTHEYVLAMYGIVLWQISLYLKTSLSFKAFSKIAFKRMLDCLVWVGMLIVFDDEILAWYNHYAHVDYSSPPFFMYIFLGFITNILITFVTHKYKSLNGEITNNN